MGSQFLKLSNSHERVRRIYANKISHSNCPQAINDLLDEINICQIEIELQNEQLDQSHEKLLSLQNYYINFYDFTSGSYFTLNRKYEIQAVNFAGIKLLDKNRNYLLKKIHRFYPVTCTFHF